MSGKIIVIEKNYEEPLKDKIRAAAADCGYEVTFYDTQMQAASAMEDADIVFAAMIGDVHKASHLKWLALSSAGAERALAPGALPNDTCLLTNSAGAYGISLAEHMLMLTLMLLRRMPVFEEDTAKNRWHAPVPQRSIYKSRVTVLGAGDAGTRFAERVRGFEPALVTGVSRSGRCRAAGGGAAFDRMVPISSLDEVLPETDILAMSLPGTKETAGLLSEERIALLPRDAVIVNVGRGSAIDEAALIRALEEGRLWGAALDVMSREPLPQDDPLWSAPNLILTPHVAGNMTLACTRERCVDMFCENLYRLARGEQMKNIVDRQLGY